MSNNRNTVGSGMLFGTFYAALFVAFSLVSCGSPPDSTPNTSPSNTSVSLSASPATITSGATSTLNWSSTNSSVCSLSGGQFGIGTAVNASGSQTTQSLTASTTYTLTCTGLSGSVSQSTTVAVGVIAPVVTISATPPSIQSGSTSHITWSSTDSISCISSGGGGTDVTGSFDSPALTANTTYTVTCTGPGGTTSQSTTVTVSGASCSTTGATAAISLPGVMPSRLSGVAPLSVFFDATTTSAIATTRPFHDLEYRWNFGENIGVLAALPGGANWINGSTQGNRNSATGPVAGHVYETPGTYTVTLSATDGTNTVLNSCTQIVVQDPDLVFADTKTTCVAATNLPVQGVGGCPAHANTAVQPNFATAISNYALSGRRILFKRGDIFTSSSIASIVNTGPGTLGAFGSGAAPIVRMSGNTTILLLSSATTPNIKDWRVIDLELDGMANPSSMGIGSAGSINQVTLLRLKIHDTHNGISFSDSILDWLNSHSYPGQTMWDQISIVDSSVLHTIGGAGGNGVGLAAKRLLMLGNLVDDSIAAEHILRIFNVNKGVISNNTLSRQATAKAIIKMHGPTWLNGMPPPVVAGSYTEQALISDNQLVASNGTDWTVNTGPQNAQSDERLRNIIVERNWFVGGNTTQVDLVVNAVEETIRNNICVNKSGKFIQVSYRSGTSTGLEPPPLNVRVYNNTVYSNSSAQSGDVIVADIRAPSTNTSVYNNLGSAPFVINPILINNMGTGTIQGNNLLNNNPSALFVNSTPAIPLDFNLKSLPNPARDAGLSTIPVMSDFFRVSRPLNGITDIGAIEGP